MFHVVLVQPEIPSNTGNIGRLCVATNSQLHLVKPLGFSLNDKYLKRAGLDYWTHLKYKVHVDYNQWLSSLSPNQKTIFFSTKAKKSIYDCHFDKGDYLVFGSETKGLGTSIIEPNLNQCFRIPMPGSVRSLNLANAVSVVVYEALRQAQLKDKQIF